MEGFANFFMACANVFTLQGLLWLTFATALGMVVGALPGLSATLGIALLSGLTFTMETNQAITVLMGVYVGAIYGGSITAILINVPGTGSAAATLASISSCNPRTVKVFKRPLCSLLTTSRPIRTLASCSSSANTHWSL